MTDANEERPLTRRELRARERAAELAATGGVPPVPEEGSPEFAAAGQEHVGRHSTPSVPSALAETEALDMREVRAQSSDASAEQADAASAEAAQPESGAETAAAPVVEKAPTTKPRGRFFGRKKDKAAQQAPADAQRAEEQAAAEAAAPVVGAATADDAAAETAEVEPIDDAAGLEVIEAELAEDQHDGADAETAAAPDALVTDDAPNVPSAPAAPGASVPAPSSARRSSAQIDDVQGLDTVNDAEVDDLEIDEVVVEQPRVSSRRVAEVTPAELEDRRGSLSDDDETLATGPSRGQSQRLPVIVNVVSDTSEHHIADLREQGVAGSGGTSTSSFTANALVLPAGSETPDFKLEGDDGLLVTGSIDVPEGFASSGRGRAAIDGNDVDADVAEGEVSSPETSPVRASKAVSSYANARVQIAPKKQRANMWPVAIGVGAGAFVVGVGAVLTWALTQGLL